MEAVDVLHSIIQESMGAANLSDLEIGTVTQENPLEIQCQTSMNTLQAPVLYLTESVVEKKIPILEHNHMGVHGATSSALLKNEIICKEHGENLPVENGYIILNRRLEKEDKVLLLKVRKGQKFIILSRIFKVV